MVGARAPGRCAGPGGVPCRARGGALFVRRRDRRQRRRGLRLAPARQARARGDRDPARARVPGQVTAGPSGWSLGARLARRILLAPGLVWCLVLAAGLAVMWHEMGEIANDALEARAQSVARSIARSGAAPGVTGERGTEVRVVVPGAAPPAAPWPPLAADGRREVAGWTVVRVSTSAGVVVEVGQHGAP